MVVRKHNFGQHQVTYERAHDRTRLALNLAAWFVLAILSACYSRQLLDAYTHDPHTLTLVTLFYAAVLKITISKSRLELVSLLRDYELICLGVFNLASVLFTSLGVSVASAHVTYMIKSAEPFFMVVMSHVLIDKIHTIHRIALALLPICTGVPLLFAGTDKYNLDGSAAALLSSLATSALNIAYKHRLDQSRSSPLGKSNHRLFLLNHTRNSRKSPSTFELFLNVGFVSFVLFVPVYLLQNLASLRYYSSNFLTEYYNFLTDFTLSPFSSPKCVRYFILASILNLAYRFFSLKVLADVDVLSHSVMTSVKRILVVASVVLVFAPPILPMHSLGMTLAYLGVFFYSIESRRSRTCPRDICSKKVKNTFKTTLVILIGVCLLKTCFPHKRLLYPSVFDSHPVFVSPRNVCIEKIQTETKSIIRPLLPNKGRFYLFDYPIHRDLEDSIVWFGEEITMRDMGSSIQKHLDLDRQQSTGFFRHEIEPDDTILVHGADNDYYKLADNRHLNVRNVILRFFSNQKILFLPRLLNDTGLKNATPMFEQQFYDTFRDLTILTKTNRSFEFLLDHQLDRNRIVSVPDLSFMIGNSMPRHPSRVDILVIRRADARRRFEPDEWSRSMRHHLIGRRSVTYMIRDWSDFAPVSYTRNDLFALASNRVDLANHVLSLGRIIVTDRTHASILSFLMAKPHVIVDDQHETIRRVRDRAFQDKPECVQFYVRGYYTKSIDEAFGQAFWMLENMQLFTKNT